MERSPALICDRGFFMARQDIEINAEYGEIEMTDNLVGKEVHEFRVLPSLDGGDNEGMLYAEVSLPHLTNAKYREGSEIRVHIPYKADPRKLQVRIRTDRNASVPEYWLNPRTNREWFSVVRVDDAGTMTPVRMSEIWKWNGKGLFNLVLQGGVLQLFSGDETDLMIRPALSQNEAFLLKACAGNLYQHPTTGVGLIDYLHANLENSGLAAKLRSEFTADRMVIHNAYMDSATGELLLEVTEQDG